MRAGKAIAAALLGLWLAGAPQAATAQAGDEVYAGPGGWRVIEHQVECALFSADGPHQPVLALAGFHDGQLMLEINLRRPIPAEHGEGPFTLHIDDTSEQLGLTGHRDELALLGLPPHLIAALRRGQSLSVRAGGQVLATIPLAGSAAAFRALEACRAGLPAGPFRPQSPPPPPLPAPLPVAEPNLTAPLPANRVVAPIMIERWFTAFDYPASEMPAEGTTRYRVTVNRAGRVRECVILASSGSSLLDETTCVVLARRARFDPATDGTGQPVEADFSGRITWQMPD